MHLRSASECSSVPKAGGKLKKVFDIATRLEGSIAKPVRMQAGC